MSFLFLFFSSKWPEPLIYRWRGVEWCYYVVSMLITIGNRHATFMLEEITMSFYRISLQKSNTYFQIQEKRKEKKKHIPHVSSSSPALIKRPLAIDWVLWSFVDEQTKKIWGILPKKMEIKLGKRWKQRNRSWDFWLDW